MELKVFEGFAGYGGGSFALKKAGIPFVIIGYSEINKHAIKIYEQNHLGINYGDMTKINPDEVPDFNFFMAGFPCQDVSTAGLRDLSKGRTNQYKEILRIARVKKPKYMLLENVKGLLSIKIEDRKLINIIVNDLNKIGYGVIWKVLNSKDYGIPQNRERIWFVCKLGGWNFGEFQFPQKEKLKIFIKDILEKDVDKKYYLKEKQIKFITDTINQKKKYCQINNKIAITQTRKQFQNWNGNYIQFDVSGKGYKSQEDRIFNSEGVMCCIPNANPSNKVNIFASRKREYGRNIEFNNEGITNSLTSFQKDNYLLNNFIFRRLTPRECFRLMGFLDDEINITGIIDSHLYELAGNGWDINLVSKILKQMFKQEVLNL